MSVKFNSSVNNQVLYIPIIVCAKRGYVHRINIVTHRLVQVLIREQAMLRESMTRNSQNLVERRKLICADILGKGQRHVVETLERVFDTWVGLQEEEQRRAPILLDESRHSI